MTKSELQLRTKNFALAIISLTSLLPNRPEAWILGKQILRSGTSVAANYRAVARAKSDKDFIFRLGTVIEEADQTLFWLELINESYLLPQETQTLTQLKNEANELISIFVATIKTIKKRLNLNPPS